MTLSALALAGLTAGQNGNDPLIYNNRTGMNPNVQITFSVLYVDTLTALAIPIPLMPSPMRSNTLIKRIASIECWRNDYPCGQGGGQRSQRLVAKFVEPTPAIAARVPPPKFFSTRTDVKAPDETDSPRETGHIPLDTPLPLLEPTAEASMGILPVPVSLGGDPHTYEAPQEVVTSEAIFSALPITTSTSAVGTSIPYSPHSAWPSHWRGATSKVAAAPSQTIRCNGTLDVPSTPVLTPVPATSSHFAIPTDPSLPITGTYTEPTVSFTSTAQLNPMPITIVSGIFPRFSHDPSACHEQHFFDVRP